MIVREIAFENFRNIASGKVAFSEGTNVLCGPNAQGKSNILEGIYLFARGRSFRGAHDHEMIKRGESSASLALTFHRSGDRRDTVLEARLCHGERRKYFRGGAPLTGVREVIGNMRAVLFCPAHLEIAGGGPSARRQFLDIAVSQLYPAYIDELTRYTRLIAHRNALLKESARRQVSPGEWESFADMLALSCARIAVWRQGYVNRVGSHAARVFSEMTGGTEMPEFRYVSQCARDAGGEVLSACGVPTERTAAEIAAKLAPHYTDSIERESKVGSTLYGIHRDDIAVTLNGMDVRDFASQGQLRSVALSMKLAEGEISREETGEYPVFLLDDVLSELDAARRGYVLSAMEGKQIIITSCDADVFGACSDANIIKVESGSVSPLTGGVSGEAAVSRRKETDNHDGEIHNYGDREESGGRIDTD